MRSMTRTPFTLIFVLILSVSTHPTLASEPLWKFGIVPQQSAVKLAAKWAPVMEHISSQTGHQFRFETAPDIPEFERRLSKGHYDIAYMNPYHYAVFSESPGYRAFAKQQDKKLKGILVTRKDSGIDHIDQLRGKQLAFPSPAAFAASMVTRSRFQQEGIEIDPVYVSSHDSVYLTVASGLYPAGGGIIRTFNNLDDKRKDDLRVLWTSAGYTPHAFAAHPDTPLEVIEALARSLEDLHKTSVGRELLQSLNMKALEAARDADWEDIRGLGLETLGVIGTSSD